MNESSISVNMDISTSLVSKETEVSYSFDNQEDIKSQIINSVILNLKELIDENEIQGRNKYSIRDFFYLPKIPSISLNEYIHRLVDLTNMEISSLILSIIYIDKFCDNFNYILNMFNIYKIILVTCLISIKYNEDNYFDTKKYSEIAGISVDELNKLEERMFVLLDYNLYVESNFYQQYYDYFSKYHKNKK